jgi:hypothetical protein
MPATLQPPPPRPTATRPDADRREAAAAAPLRRRWPWLVLPVAIVLLVLAAAQVVLPGMATDRLRDRLEKQGAVTDARVSAFPAVKLLWGQADEVEVRMERFRPANATGDGGGTGATGGLGDAIARTQATDRIDVFVGSLAAGPLKLRDVRMTKDGDRLRAEAMITDAELDRALPPGLDLRPVTTPGGQLLLEGGVNAFGFEAQGRARLLARAGKLVIRPEGPPMAALATATVFSDPRIDFRSVGAQSRPGGFILSAEASAS